MRQYDAKSPASPSVAAAAAKNETWAGFHGEILKKPIRWEDGHVIPPTEPGLGVELDDAVAIAHPDDGAALHLAPSFVPVYPPG